VRNSSDKNIEALQEREKIFCDALDNFNTRVQSLPPERQVVVLRSFYREMRDTLFILQLALETNTVQKINTIASR
jgi:hypothetical protein